MTDIVAVDMFVVATATFQLFYALILWLGAEATTVLIKGPLEEAPPLMARHIEGNLLDYPKTVLFCFRMGLREFHSLGASVRIYEQLTFGVDV
jgi:hypothetical protein